ncbi:MAG: hypothetical protein IJ439_07600 [Tyzzerella sp.]|nr:hypothetical protein [Tyzzerella sp.]
MKKRILAIVLTMASVVFAINAQNVYASDKYSIEIEASDHGTVVANCTEAEAGMTVALNVEANKGYVVQAVYVNDEKLEDYTSFTMPGEDVVITPLFAKGDSTYSISVEPSPYARLLITETSACAGDKIVLEYYALTGYVLDSVMLNGEKTELDDRNAFTMPGENVVVSASFKKAIEPTDVSIKINNANSDGTSYWYFEYTPSAFCITAKVIDETLITTGEPKYQDYVECMINMYQDGVSSWTKGKTVKYTVTVGGEAYQQTAISELGFGRIYGVKDTFSYSVTEKQIENKDGYSGYEVKMSIPYELLGTTYEEAKGNILVCPAYRNSESLVTRNWKCTFDWFDVSSHLRVTEE